MRLAHHLMTWTGWAQAHGQPFDFDTGLREIKEAGYEGVELGGDERTLGDPQLLRRRIAEHGLSIAAFGSSVTANPWPPNTEQYQRELEYAAALDISTITVCGGFLPEPRRTTFESDYALFAENLAAMCVYAERHGQTIAYHPHCGCIVETIAEMQRLWRYLPNLQLCIDTGHLAAVQCDPIALIQSDPGKVRHIHLKDWDAEQRRFAELGCGSVGLDFSRILAALDHIGYDGWLVVERDDPPIPPAESARISNLLLQRVLRSSDR